MGETHHRSRRMRRVCTFAVTALLVPAPALIGGTAHAEENPKTAVVGPLLDFFDFGANVGAPVFCGTTSATAGSAFTELGAAEQGDLLVDGINSNCGTFSTQAGDWVAQGRTAQAPMAAAVNPILNPAIAQGADGVTKFAKDFDPALAPFGPTVAGSGSTIGFFAGTPGGDS